jgi:SAM-dependent methyltransferase
MLPLLLSFHYALLGQTQSGIGPAQAESVSPYLPTPVRVAEKMLEMARVKPNERLYDLGSGDGRIVIMAARKYGARAIGIELKPDLCRLARSRVGQLGLGKEVTIIQGDFFAQDLSNADVVTVYLVPEAMPRLRAYLEKYAHHGMRIVVCQDEIPGWTPAGRARLHDPDTGWDFRLVLYEISRPGDWVSFGRFGNQRHEDDENSSARPQQRPRSEEDIGARVDER